MLKFFRIPFATSGDKTTVPDAVDVNGFVSYTSGYGFDYQRQKTDPAAKNIERDKMNEIFFDITTAIAELQAQGVPDFITSALNGGTAYSYAANSLVRYGGDLYLSLVGTNTALPSDATKWALLPTPARIQAAAYTSAVSAGTADAITAAFTPAIAALPAAPGTLAVRTRAGFANATATPTFSPNGLTPKTIVKGANLPLAIGDIPGAGAWIELVYDATLDKWVLQNPANGIIAQTPTVGFRNRLINGAPSVDSRNSGAAQTFVAGAALAYCVDHWYGYASGANVTGQRVAGSGADQYRYRFTGAASVAGIGFGQRIEQANSYDLAGSTAVLSVDLANSLLTTVTWSAYYANSANTFGTLAAPTRTLIATGTFTVNAAVARYSAPISIPVAATTGIEIVLSVGAQTSGTWTIGNVQLETGATASAFERRPINYELEACKRYRRPLKAVIYSANNSGGGFNIGQSFNFPSMFAAPTVEANTAAANTNAGATASIAGTDSSITLYGQTTSNGQIQINYTGALLAEIP